MVKRLLTIVKTACSLTSMGLTGVLVSSTVFKTACDQRAWSGGFDSHAVPPTKPSDIKGFDCF